MSRDWKPGDVAVIAIPKRGQSIAMFMDGGEWETPSAEASGETSYRPRDIFDARALVVIDPEDREQVERLARATWEQYGARWDTADPTRVMRFADDMQAVLRSLVTPPTTTEPDTEGEFVHCVMYRDNRMGTLCDSGAYGLPVLFTAVTEKATCPGCRKKLDGGQS